MYYSYQAFISSAYNELVFVDYEHLKAHHLILVLTANYALNLIIIF